MNKAMKRGWEWEVCRLACENMGKQFMSLDVSDVTVSDGLKRRVEGLLTEAREAAARRKTLRRRVTVILVAAVLLLLTACASIPAVREKLYDIVFSEHDKYYRFQTKPKETEENTAETAPLPPFENKKPTYIPEGFELIESDVGLQETFYMYLNSNNSNDYFVFGQDYVMLYIAGISSMLGHIYPVMFGFKGGKGIATMLGMFLASNPIVTLITIGVGAVIWAIFEYGSVVSFLCITTLTVVEGVRARMNLQLYDRKIICLILFAIFAFTWYAHRKNIERLLLGKESKASLIRKTKKKLKAKVG